MQKRNALYEVESTEGITDASGEQVDQWEVGDEFHLTEEAWEHHYSDRRRGTKYVVASIMLHRDDPNDMSFLTPDPERDGEWAWVPVIDVERAG